MTASKTFVIVGAGLAGANAAETLRAEGFDGRLVLIGTEEERPYERPALSKGYLRGTLERERVYVHPEAFYVEQGIEFRPGRTAVRLDVAIRQLMLDDGERLHYDRLLLTTGAGPRKLSIPGADLDGVLYLRDLADSDSLRERLSRGGPVVVIGAGWLGSEVAACARERGLEVTMVTPAPVPMERALGCEVGGIYRDLHLEHGVRLLVKTKVAALEGDRVVERVRTSDGSGLECAFVVAGIGVRPRTRLAAEAGLPISNGLLVDEHLRTPAPAVFAAGDVANAYHPFYGERLRVEHWANALHQGPCAARNMLGRGKAYDHLPYFFSDQYDTGMEYVGDAPSWDRVVFRGDPADREFIAFWITDDRVVAGMSFNIADVSDRIRRLIRSRVAVDDRALADPEVALEALAPEGQDSFRR
jgi:3-phenylpropionate/trans-cinnamate dioxygenase ferredoxin reductase subunit